MKLLEQVLNELGADTVKAFTVVPSFGGYFKSVKSVAEYTPEKITLVLKKTVLTIEQDIFVKGDIKAVKID